MPTVSSKWSLFFCQMLQKFAEDDRIEQMNAQKRRMKQLEHKKAVEKLIEDRRLQFQRERVRQTRKESFALRAEACKT